MNERYEKILPPKPGLDAEFINAKIDQLWSFVEEDGKNVLQWCQGIEVAVQK